MTLQQTLSSVPQFAPLLHLIKSIRPRRSAVLFYFQSLVILSQIAVDLTFLYITGLLCGLIHCFLQRILRFWIKDITEMESLRRGKHRRSGSECKSKTVRDAAFLKAEPEGSKRQNSAGPAKCPGSVKC